MMRYIHPNSDTVVLASGSHKLYEFLESRGWRTEEQIELESKKAVQKEKAKEFFDKCKEKKKKDKEYLKSVKEQIQKDQK